MTWGRFPVVQFSLGMNAQAFTRSLLRMFAYLSTAAREFRCTMAPGGLHSQCVTHFKHFSQQYSSRWHRQSGFTGAPNAER
jgi:hypothetical protein